MTMPFKFMAKVILRTLYSHKTRNDFIGRRGASLTKTRAYDKAIIWLTKKRLIRKDVDYLIITAKGRRYAEKKHILHNPLYAQIVTSRRIKPVGKSSKEGAET